MIKNKNIYFLAPQDEEKDSFDKRLLKYDEEIQAFIDLIYMEGHTFMSCNSISFGRFEPNNRIRTVITYKENCTRTVIVEKS